MRSSVSGGFSEPIFLGRARGLFPGIFRPALSTPGSALSPPLAAAEPVLMSVKKTPLEHVVVVVMILVAEPPEEELGKHEKAEGLPVGDLPEAEYVRHQPVPEPFQDKAENEGE